MDPTAPPNAVLDRFSDLAGRPWRLERFGAGRIHETWALFDVTQPADSRRADPRADGLRLPSDRSGQADVLSPAGEPAFLLQRLNTLVFPDYRGLMANAAIVTGHVSSPMRFLPARDGRPYAERDDGVWRVMPYVASSVPVPVPADASASREAAVAFGRFAAGCASIDPARLVEVIPGFHDTPARYRRLAEALRGTRTEAPVHELAELIGERAVHLGFVSDRLGTGALPRRVCHNDAKADNVLLHRETGRAICVVDLDTVMPGSPLYDVGDLLRSAGASVGEDEPETDRVGVRWECAEAIVDGFLEGAGEILTAEERRLARAAGWLLAMEQAIRYLTDHVSGDVYYRVAYEGQNLDRARNQVALALAYEERGWCPQAPARDGRA